MSRMRLLIMYSTAPPTSGHVERLAALDPRVEVVVARDEAGAREAAPGAEVFLGHRYLAQCLPEAGRLKWVQSSAAGVDHLLTPALVARRPILTRCPVFADTIAWHALAMGLALVRGLSEAACAPHRQPPVAPDGSRLPPLPRTAVVVGMGDIGRALGELLKGLGLRVLGVVRTRRDVPARCCDEVLPPDRWRSRLGEADLLFLSIPGAPENRHFIDNDALARLPRHAVVVNVGRGMTLDHAALLRRLESLQLGGAGLDVLDEVPADVQNLLRQTPHVLITPKIASFTEDRQARFEAFVEQQVRAYLTGKPLVAPVELPAAPPLPGDRP